MPVIGHHAERGWLVEFGEQVSGMAERWQIHVARLHVLNPFQCDISLAAVNQRLQQCLATPSWWGGF